MSRRATTESGFHFPSDPKLGTSADDGDPPGLHVRAGWGATGNFQNTLDLARLDRAVQKGPAGMPLSQRL
jgi:hypothetical protein